MPLENPEYPTTILLIEDDDDHAQLAEFHIGEHDPSFSVLRLSDGEAALKYLDEVRSGGRQAPWLILMDLKIPKYDGHEVLSFAKSDRALARVPVVVFTTSNSGKDIGKAMGGHANSYIVKPMEPDRYGETIATILDYWRLDRHHLAPPSPPDMGQP